MLDGDVALQHMITKKMMMNLNVLCLRVLNWVVSNLDGTLIVTVERHVLHVDAVVLESLLHPQQLSTARTSSNILSFNSRPWYAVLFLQGPTDQRSSEEMTCA